MYRVSNPRSEFNTALPIPRRSRARRAPHVDSAGHHDEHVEHAPAVEEDVGPAHVDPENELDDEDHEERGLHDQPEDLRR